MTAGREYLDALVQLGLAPAYLGWGWDPSAEEWLLVLVTSIVEAGGPLKLNQLLFRAYNAKVTPQEISPFIVRVFSPEIIGGKEATFWLLGRKNIEMRGVPGKVRDPKLVWTPVGVENVQQTFMGLELEMVNSYETLPGAVERALAGYHRRQQDWQKFKRNVERLAA